MVMTEEPFVSDYLDKNGIKHGDRIYLDPLSGRKVSFLLNRTCIDFLSGDMEAQVESLSKRVLGSQKTESFHVKMLLVESSGRGRTLKKRYLLRVIKGGPVKLNGVFVLEGVLEDGDRLEIGFNKLVIKRIDRSHDFDVQKKIIQNYKKIVASNLNILLEGETGVGKSSLAAKIHKESSRLGRFVHLNISAFSPSLIESELFGHVKGAFTGAFQDKKGAFREANGGTLFIDEVDSLPLNIQTKLLLFLDNLSARPVGGATEYSVDVRLVFSSGVCLENLVSKKMFRKDFYFRVSQGQKIRIEPLRDRIELIENFCQLFMIDNNCKLDYSLIEFYQTLPWPGNYRQLKSHLARKLVLSNGHKLSFDETDEKLILESSGLIEINNQSHVYTLNDIRRAYAKKIFFEFDKNYKKTAEKLSISTKVLKKLVVDDLRVT
ncbi:MAG: sigma-54-dependent Fis family transcriptional regulator [Halobacteriovoraceae bacterium]|nr:sigma-54-dependent Fis family transcriptional regulator [Halobacteriovoraceae bacterium]